jgi:hypothetical protein
LIRRLEVTERVPSGLHDIVFYVHPKGKEHINDYRRSHCDERNVNEVLPDRQSGNAHEFTDPGADSENLPFDIAFEPVHIPNLVITFLFNEQLVADRLFFTFASLILCLFSCKSGSRRQEDNLPNKNFNPWFSISTSSEKFMRICLEKLKKPEQL